MANLIITETSFCRRCQVTTDLTIDHVIPKKFKGFKGIANQQILCRPCNQKKGSKLLEPWVDAVSISNYFGFLHGRLLLENLSEEDKIKIRTKLYAFFEQRCSAFLADQPSRQFVLRADRFFMDTLDTKVKRLGYKLKFANIYQSSFPIGRVPQDSLLLIK